MGNCQNDTSQAQENNPNVPAGNPSCNPFYQLNVQQSNQQRILNMYKFHSNYDDKFIGKCSILEEKSTNNLYLCKETIFSTEDQFQSTLKYYEIRKNKLNHENVIRIKHIIIKENQGFIFDEKKIILILQYPFMDVQHEKNNRIIKKLTFSKDQILNFIISAIRGYSNIEQANFKNDKVKLSYIFLGIHNKLSLVKVTDTKHHKLEKSNLQNIFEHGPEHHINRDIYLAPEQFASYYHSNRHPKAPKAGVFSLGMSILDLCVMNESTLIYDYDLKEINYRQIKCRVQIAGEKYGGVVQKFLQDMLYANEQQRLTFQELQDRIPSILNYKTKESGSKMHLSMIKVDKSSYLNNSKFNPQKSSVQRSLTNSRVSVVAPGSRIFASGIGNPLKEKEEDLQTIHEKYTNGNQYIGQKSLKTKLKHGKGKYIFKDGSYYEGLWINNKIQGKGSLYFANGKVQYNGEWKEDEYSGWGTLNRDKNVESCWSKYEGQFSHGMKQGRGRMYFRDNSIYDGQFKGDKIHGRGRKITPNGEIIDKVWQITNPELFIDLN